MVIWPVYVHVCVYIISLLQYALGPEYTAYCTLCVCVEPLLSTLHLVLCFVTCEFSPVLYPMYILSCVRIVLCTYLSALV